MGQIVGLNAKPKRANLNALSLVPTPAAGEYILVSSDNSMNAAGQGNFDCYIVGDGTSAATALPIRKINAINGSVYYGNSMEPLTFKAIEDGTFSFSGKNLLYSIDSGSWSELVAGESTPTITAGSTISWKTPESTPNATGTLGTFSSTGKFDVSGNIMSLLYTDYLGKVSLSGNKNIFLSLFKNGNVVNAKDLQLPATTLGIGSYYQMFLNNQYLVSAPNLPALAVTQDCYRAMFRQCASLTYAPALPATQLGVNCYQDMFYQCSNLVSAPDLPATQLAQGCYMNMFYMCTSLVTAPVLPAETIPNYAYNSMFAESTSLNYLKIYAKTYSASHSGTYLLKNNARTGTLVKYADGPTSAPSGWTTEYITD